MRLKYVSRADFRKSELTNYIAVLKENPMNLKQGECICLVSSGEDQLVFVYAISDVEGEAEKRTVIHSVRLRLVRKSADGTLVSGTKWNPLMLANYAGQVGIELEGIKRFEEYYKHLVQDHKLQHQG